MRWLLVVFATTLVESDSCFVYVREGEDLVLMASKNPHREILDRLKLKVGEGITGWVAEHRQTVALGLNAWKDPRFKVFSDLPEDQFESFLSVPILARGRAVGVINLQNRKPHEYTAREIAAISTMGAFVGAEIEMVRLEVESAQDVMERRKAEDRFYKAFNANPEPIAIATIPEERYLDVNESFLLVTGFQREEVIGRTASELNFWTVPEERARFMETLSEQGRVRDLEIAFNTKSGEKRTGLESAEIIDIGGQVCMLAILKDITELKQAQEKLVHDAFHDPLTNLPNRALFLDRLERTVARAKRHEDYKFAVLFIDIDRFKIVNDSLGHHAGDELIIQFSKRILHSLRLEDVISRPATPHSLVNEWTTKDDTLARLGGDEFTVLLDDLRSPTDSIRVASRIQQSLAEPFLIAGQEVFTTASIGIAASSQSYASAADVLRDADIAMYRAKAQGKARCEVFDQATHDQAVGRLKLETDLRRALEREEFRVYYQPIVSLTSGKIAGFEALVRWERPGVGIVGSGRIHRRGGRDGADRVHRKLGAEKGVRASTPLAPGESGRAPPDDERECFGAPIQAARHRGTSGKDRARNASGSGRNQAGSYRDRDDGQCGKNDSSRQRPQESGCAAEYRRFRDRIFVLELPAAVSHAHAQDRPLVCAEFA